MTIHDLKCWPEYFAAVECGEKTFEVRKNDRNFAKGDILCLHEWNYKPPVGYTGRFVSPRVTYVLSGPGFGIEKGYVVMGIEMRSLTALRQRHAAVVEAAFREGYRAGWEQEGGELLVDAAWLASEARKGVARDDQAR